MRWNSSLVVFRACAVGVLAVMSCSRPTTKTAAPYDDAVVRMAKESLISGEDEGGLCQATFSDWAVLFQDDFSRYSNTPEWPMNAGYHGDWEGDWYTVDGAARVYNPNWANGGTVPNPKFTGFVKFLKVFPAAGATISVETVVEPAFTSPESTANILIYYFSSNNTLLWVDPGHKIFAGPKRTLSVFGSPIPVGTARIAVVPIVFLDTDEQGTADYDSMRVTYEPPNSITKRDIVTDNFSTFETTSTYGANQPSGWTEFGSDWYVLAESKWATLWNPTWSGGQAGVALPVETGMTKTVTLPSPTVAGDMITARALIAAGFSDPDSFGDIRIVFDSEVGPSVSSPQIRGATWGYQTIDRQPIPEGTSTIYVIARGYLGPHETSSLYVDDVNVAIESGPTAEPVTFADTDEDQTVDICDNCLTLANFDQLDANGDGIGDVCTPNVKLALTPSNVTMAKGQSTTFKAMGTFDDGTTKDLSAYCVWATSNSAVATISGAAPTKGQSLAAGVGFATISVQYGSNTGSTSVNVTPAVLVSLDVQPVGSSVAKGSTLQFTATGTYSDNSTVDLTASVTWSSSATSVATISSAGLASGASVGSATISASLGGVSDSASLNVTAATLASIEVQPSVQTIAKGTSVQFSATGIYTDNSTQDLTQQVSWSSSSSAAQVSNAAGSKGLATGANVGTATVTATLGALTDTAALTVTAAALVSIDVQPATASAAKGTKLQFSATGLYSDSSHQDLTTQVTWASGSQSTATVSNAAGTNGLATAVNVGSATLTASSGAVVGSRRFTVTTATLVALNVQPVGQTIAKGTTLQFSVSGTYSDGSSQDLTTQASWSSSQPAVASISNTAGSKGLVTGASIGSVTITATFGAASGTSTLTVSAATLTAISVDPSPASVAKGNTVQFRANGIYTDGTTQDVTNLVTWASASTAVATISNASGSKGLSYAAGLGSSTVTATLSGKSGSSSLTVTSAILASIEVSPTDETAAKGTKLQFEATGVYSDGTTQDLTSNVTWSSSNTSLASVSNAAGSRGLATAVGAGVADIRATLGAFSDETELTVTSAVLDSLDIQPGIVTLTKGSKVAARVIGTYSDDTTQDLTDTATWSSEDATTASVSNSAGSKGSISGVNTGTTTVTVTVGDISDTADVNVTNATLQSIAVTPANSTLVAGLSQQYTATGTYSDGSKQEITTQVVWASSSSSVATISNVSGSNGRLTAVTAGSTTVTARQGVLSASTSLTVSSAVLTSITVTAPSLRIPKSFKAQFTATGNYNDGTTKDLTASVTWASSTTKTATISNTTATKGLASVRAVGTTTISATFSGKTASAVLTGTSATISSIAVTPAGQTTLKVGQTLQLKAVGTFSDGSTLDLTTQASWSSSKSKTASVSKTGLVTGKKVNNSAATINARKSKKGSTKVLVQ